MILRSIFSYNLIPVLFSLLRLKINKYIVGDTSIFRQFLICIIFYHSLVSETLFVCSLHQSWTPISNILPTKWIHPKPRKITFYFIIKVTRNQILSYLLNFPFMKNANSFITNYFSGLIHCYTFLCIYPSFVH